MHEPTQAATLTMPQERGSARTVRRARLPSAGVLLPVAILAATVVAAVFAPLLTPHQPTVGALSKTLLPPFWQEGGMALHPLGTDMLGRDILTRLIYGARTSLIVSLTSIAIAGVIGTAIGLVAGYYGGHIDTLLSRLVDVMLSLPPVLVILVLAVTLGASFLNVIVVISAILWARYARQARGEALSIKQKDFVALARVAGCSNLHIILHHIFPNLLNTMVVLATLQVGYVIILESSLSFLGVGIPPPTPSWGLMVAEGRSLVASAWWVSFFPGLATLLTVLSGNLLGDWLRDALDPKLRQI